MCDCIVLFVFEAGGNIPKFRGTAKWLLCQYFSSSLALVSFACNKHSSLSVSDLHTYMMMMMMNYSTVCHNTVD